MFKLSKSSQLENKDAQQQSAEAIHTAVLPPAPIVDNGQIFQIMKSHLKNGSNDYIIAMFPIGSSSNVDQTLIKAQIQHEGLLIKPSFSVTPDSLYDVILKRPGNLLILKNPSEIPARGLQIGRKTALPCTIICYQEKDFGFAGIWLNPNERHAIVDKKHFNVLEEMGFTCHEVLQPHCHHESASLDAEKMAANENSQQTPFVFNSKFYARQERIDT